ncbi:MAG: hypothetical protein ACO1PM_16705 [Acidovorax sp.]
MSSKLSPYSFDDPLKDELESLITIEGDLQRAIRSLQLLAPPAQLLQESGVIGSALYTQALISYSRCFATGKRSKLNSSIFSGNAHQLALHQEIKDLRDKHAAHSVGPHEHCSIMVAAKDPNSKAEGLGVQYWFFVGGDAAHMKAFLKLAMFAQKHVRAERKRVGDQLAKKYLGPRSTWQKAQEHFYRTVEREDLYPSRPAESDTQN